MAVNLREFFTPAAMAAYWTEAVENQIPYLGRGLFPVSKKAGLDLSWIKGSRGLPISLMPSAFDAKATFRDRIGFEKMETEMPFFREGYKIKERDRQDLFRALDTNDPFAEAIIGRIFDDVADLISGADVVPERMIMQLLFPEDGNIGIAIKANGVDYTYNYDPDGTWKATNYVALTGDDLWTSTETADPFVTLDEAKQTISNKTGATLTRAIMNSYTFNLLSKVKSVQTRFLTLNGMGVAYLRPNDVRSIISETNGIDFIIYDKKYRDEDKVTHNFIPDGYVCLIPDGNLGRTFYGTTPEEADLRGASGADVSIVNTGVAITRIIEEHPVNINTFASEIVLPTFERMDDVLVLKVIA